MRGEKGKKFKVHYILLWKCYMKLNAMLKWINDNKSKRKQLSVSQFASDRNNITVRHTTWFSCCFSKRHWVKQPFASQEERLHLKPILPQDICPQNCKNINLFCVCVFWRHKLAKIYACFQSVGISGVYH